MSITEPIRARLEIPVDQRTLEILERRDASGSAHRRGWLVRRMLLVADLVGLSLAFVVTEVLFVPSSADRVDPRGEWVLFFLTLPVWIVVAKLYGLYDRDEERANHSTVDEFVGVLHLVTVGAWLLVAGLWVTDVADPNVPKVATFWAAAIGSIVLLRVAARAFCRRRVSYLQNTLIVGAGYGGQLVARKLGQHPEYGINLVGFVDADPKERVPEVEHVPVIGAPQQLRDLIPLLGVERVIVAFSRDSRERTVELIEELREFDVQVDIVPQVFEAVGPGADLHDIEGIQLIGISPLRLSTSSLIVKRAADIVLSAIALILLAPVFAVVAILIVLDTPGPVFYRHDRVGKGGQPIQVLKFRTMHLRHCRGAGYGGRLAEHTFEKLMDDPALRAEFEAKQKLADDPRVTRVGRFLRRTSLDEIPQFWNVLEGDLSLVGPRPVMAEEVERYGGHAKFLLSNRPGITGYWQINGRSSSSYEDRVRLDMAYVGNWSLGLDLTILAKTLRVLASGDGAV